MNRIDPERLSELLLDIHRTALEPDGWPHVMNRVADAIQAHSSHLMVVDPDTGAEALGFLERQNPDAHRVYMRDYFPTDIRVARMSRATIGTILGDRDVWRPEERVASPLYHDYQRVHRLHEITGANLSTGGHLVWFGVGRREEEPFEDESLALLRIVLPHVRQAVRHHLDRIEMQVQRDALWRLDSRALFLLAPDGRVRASNAAADALAEAGWVRLAGGRLVLGDRAAQDLLGCALASLRRGLPLPAACHAVLVADRTGEHRFGLRLMPTDDGAATALLAVLSPLDHGTFTQEEIGRFAAPFSLTPAEARVVGAVAAGRTVEDFAAGAAIRTDTARKQLKSAMAKTGCRTQKDLVRMVERFCFLSLR